MLQLYYGDGKGKTTAAIGAAVRAAGSGMRVLLVPFFKKDDTSEIRALRQLPQVELLFPREGYTLFQDTGGAEGARLSAGYQAAFEEAAARCAPFDLLIFDEALFAYQLELLDRARVCAFLQAEKQRRELILTGRAAPEELLTLADYASEIRAVRHPYTQGIPARRGIEY